MRMSPEDVMAKYENIKSFIYESNELSEQQVEAMRNLFTYLETQTEWLTAFCSTRFHNSFEGGLLEHSVNVVNCALKIKRVLAPELSDVNVVITALLHDCGKHCEYSRKPPTERQKAYGYPGSMGINENVPYMTHEDRSLFEITRYYPYLTEEMYCAIAMHNEPWLTSVCQFKQNKYMTILQYADYWACLYIDEPGE